MKIPTLLRSGALLTALACSLPVCSVARAASGGSSGSTETITASPGHYTLEIHKGYIIADGKEVAPATVGNILDYLKKQNHDFSLALGPRVSDVRVGEMILQMDHFDTRAICVAIIASADSPLTMEAIDDVGYTLTGAQLTRQVAVFNLSNYLPAATTSSDDEQKKVNALTQIIGETMADMNPYPTADANPAFSYHEGAHLLIVTGDAQAIDVATKVIDALVSPWGKTSTLQGSTNLVTHGSGYEVTWTPDSTMAELYQDTLTEEQEALDKLQRATAQSPRDMSLVLQLQQRYEQLAKMLQDVKQQIQLEQSASISNSVLQNTFPSSSSISGAAPTNATDQSKK